MTITPTPFVVRRTVIAAMTLAALAAGVLPTFAAERLDPDAAAAIAVERHPLIRAATRETDAAKSDKKLARSGWLPRLDFTEDYVRSDNPVFVFASKLGQEQFGPQDFAIQTLNSPDPFTNAATRVNLQQNVWDGGRTSAAGRAAKLGIVAADEGLSRTRDEIAFGAKRAFWDAVLADQMVAAARDAEKAAAANAKLATQLVEEGIAVPSDRMQAEVRLGEVRAMRVRAEQGALVARAALRRALGAPEGEEFILDPPAVDPDAVATEDDPSVAVVDALAARADLRAFDARIGQAKEGESIALSGRLPQIGVGAQYEWNGTTLFGNEGNNWTVGAFLRIPLFDGCEGLARRERARADRERLEAMREAMTDGVDLELRAATADRISSAERLRMAEGNVALSQEALRIVRERYGEGLATIVELLGAESAATQARASKALAERDLAVAGDAFVLASGVPLAPPPQTVAEKE
jgi:outer membrane protein TolC